jgi:hypothetical protein
MGGVARTFVKVREHQVQIDLMWQRSEGYGVAMDLDAATELLPLSQAHAARVRFLKIGPLVKGKFRAYGRGKPADFADLLFICTHPKYTEEVKEAADEIRLEKRELFLQEVLQTCAGESDKIRAILKLDDNLVVAEEAGDGGADIATRRSSKGPLQQT